MREFFIKDNGPCCVEKAFKMIGARWTPRILELCYLHSGMDLREFRQELPTCPETTLSRRLESLQEDGLLQYNTETRAYALTMQATDILPIMLHMQHLTLLCKHTSSGYGHAVEFVYKLMGRSGKPRSFGSSTRKRPSVSMNCSGPSRASPTRSCPSGWRTWRSPVLSTGLTTRKRAHEWSTP